MPQIDLVCNMMKNLYLSNKNKVRLTIGHFNNKVIMEAIDPVEQYKLVLNKKT